MPAELEEAFGEEVLDHTLVLLTCGDYLMGAEVEVLELYTYIYYIIVFSKSCIHLGTMHFRVQKLTAGSVHYKYNT